MTDTTTRTNTDTDNRLPQMMTFNTGGQLATMTNSELAEQYERLLARQAERIIILQAEIKERQDELDTLKTLILEQHPQPGTYQAGDHRVQVKQGSRRIDTKRFEHAYPATRYPNAYQLKPKPLSQLEREFTADAMSEYAVSTKPMVVVS